MDAVGTEIGQKMRSAIKAKLTELGCYVDDELPDYVMVMVANKRTRTQMEEDLQLFLGDNTVLFVNWLHQVLKKLQEVTISTPIIAKLPGKEKSKEKAKMKDKTKEKKDKSKEKSSKSGISKKAKKKDKAHKKKDKESKKKSKKKDKHEMIRPNIPPLLMNIEKESEPSITDVFAGQILKNHGVILEPQISIPKEEKPIIKEVKKLVLPIIDPATISSQLEPESKSNEPEESLNEEVADVHVETVVQTREAQIKEMNEIEAKIQDMKQKLQDQMDSMSDDEDFLNIRTEAEELMHDFVDEVQETTEAAETPPLGKIPTPSVPPIEIKPIEKEKEIPKPQEETLPLIELRLPKRSVRERLGTRDEPQKPPEKDIIVEVPKTPERFTPEREPEHRPSKTFIAKPSNKYRRASSPKENSHESHDTTKRLSSTVRAHVVRVAPRVRAPSLLLRAVADAHRSLLEIPPKVESQPPKVKQGIVLPMRRSVNPQKIVIQVPADPPGDNNSDISLGEVDLESDEDDKNKNKRRSTKDEYVPASITKKIVNVDYIPSRRDSPTSTETETLDLEDINIHNPSVGKEKNTQFIVTMDGFNPNAFLAKKLMSEGLLEEGESPLLKGRKPKGLVSKASEGNKQIVIRTANKIPEKITQELSDKDKDIQPDKPTLLISPTALKKRLSNTSDESDTQVIIKNESEKKKNETENDNLPSPPAKKRKASPIVFDVDKKEKDSDRQTRRERTESASSDNQVTVTTTLSTHKYDTLPPLSSAPAAVACRSFPQCRFGDACQFTHPRCKFAHLCTRRHCVYSHPPPPPLASHVVPAANYKTISSVPLPSMCKFYPNCVNPACHFYHPKPCRYGKACVNKLECNFYHIGAPPGKYKYSA